MKNVFKLFCMSIVMQYTDKRTTVTLKHNILTLHFYFKDENISKKPCIVNDLIFSNNVGIIMLALSLSNSVAKF